MTLGQLLGSLTDFGLDFLLLGDLELFFFLEGSCLGETDGGFLELDQLISPFLGPEFHPLPGFVEEDPVAAALGVEEIRDHLGDGPLFGQASGCPESANAGRRVLDVIGVVDFDGDPRLGSFDALLDPIPVLLPLFLGDVLVPAVRVACVPFDWNVLEI